MLNVKTSQHKEFRKYNTGGDENNFGYRNLQKKWFCIQSLFLKKKCQLEPCQSSLQNNVAEYGHTCTEQKMYRS